MTIPLEINASTMVIRSTRGFGRRVLDIVLTVLAWAFFSYLFAHGIWSLLSEEREGVDLHWLAPLLPGFADLVVYLVAMLVLGGVLVLWARYNFLRFRGRTRRTSLAAMDDKSLMRQYDIPADSLKRLRELPFCVIHHAPDGRIVEVASHPSAVAVGLS